MRFERKIELQILATWFLCIFILNGLLWVFPHEGFMDGAILNIYIQLLLFIVSLFIAHRCHGAQKPIFINFALLFGFVVPLALNKFIPAEYRGFSASYYFYVNKVSLTALGLFAVGYCIVDYFLQQRPVYMKYFVTGSVTIAAVGFLFSPFVFDSARLLKEPVYVTCKEMHRNSPPASLKPISSTTPEEVSQVLSESPKIRQLALTEYELQEVVAASMPYIQSGDLTGAYWRPVYRSVLSGNILLAILVIGFLVVNFSRGKPHGPYIDKILLLFLLYGIMEAFHALGSLNTSKTEISMENFTIGQYFSLIVFMAMVYAFDLRLRFSLSPAGLYYERLLQTDPTRVTRLKDEVDKIILASFFSPDKSLARLANLSEQNQQKE